jgi:anti-repressor protein
METNILKTLTFKRSLLRVFINEKGLPEFCVRDLALILNLYNCRMALVKYCKPTGIFKREFDEITDDEKCGFVNLSNLYLLVMNSEKKELLPEFEVWIRNVVKVGKEPIQVEQKSEGIEIIHISEENGKKVVSARELHIFLESKQDFSTWIKNRIEKYGLIENQDYELLHNFMEQVSGTKHLIEYALTIDAAKELAMVEGNEKGKQARRYFIEVEKKFRQPVKLPDFTDPVIAARAWADEREQRMVEQKEKLIVLNELAIKQEQLALQEKVIEETRPKAEYHDQVLQAKNCMTINVIAMEFGLTHQQLNKILHNLVVQYKQGETWVLYEPHRGKGYTQDKTYTFKDKDDNPYTSIHLYWTEKGRLLIHELLKAGQGKILLDLELAKKVKSKKAEEKPKRKAKRIVKIDPELPLNKQ